MSENVKPEPKVSLRGQSTVTHRSNLERLPILIDSMRNGVASLLERWMKTEGAAAGHEWLPGGEVRFTVDEFESEALHDDGKPYDPPRFEPYTRVTAERPFIEHAREGALVASSGWCAPSEQVFALAELDLDSVSDPFARIPEVHPRRGETWEQAGARMRAAHAARRAAAIAAGIPEDALDGRQAPPAMSQGGHWEYAVRDEEGGMTVSYRTAQEAFDDAVFGPGDEMVRRWVEEADPWEVVS